MPLNKKSYIACNVFHWLTEKASNLSTSIPQYIRRYVKLFSSCKSAYCLPLTQYTNKMLALKIRNSATLSSSSTISKGLFYWASNQPFANFINILQFNPKVCTAYIARPYTSEARCKAFKLNPFFRSYSDRARSYKQSGSIVTFEKRI